jgi:hypothetical protein
LTRGDSEVVASSTARLGVIAASGLSALALSACATTQEESAAIARADKVAQAKLEAKATARKHDKHARSKEATK